MTLKMPDTVLLYISSKAVRYKRTFYFYTHNVLFHDLCFGDAG